MGWGEARGDVVVFLDADVVPAAGWGAGVARAMAEFRARLSAARARSKARHAWGWVCHLQVETPYLPRGGPRERRAPFGVLPGRPSDAPLRWDESYGGEDSLFCADALEAGLRLVFDPRFSAAHEHERRTFGDLRRQQRRLAYGFARARPLEGRRVKRTLRRVPGPLLRSRALALRLPADRRRPAPARPLPGGPPPSRRRRVDARGERSPLRRAAAGAARRPTAAVRVSGKPILVTGAHRSGTTWAGKMLVLAPGVAYLHEPFSPHTSNGLSPAGIRPLLHGRDKRERKPIRQGWNKRSHFRYGLGAQLRSARSWRKVGDLPRLRPSSRARASAARGRSSRIRSRCSRPSGWPSASGWTSSC